MRLLGIDYGTKNVGIALAESEHKMAFPKAVLKNDKMLIMTLKKFCKSENIEMIILGESKNFEGKDNKVMGAIHELKSVLEKEAGLPVVLEPEFMTSAEAEHLQGKNKMIDASAAALILKSYLDKQHD
jgi:putative Holliday junction resolvase